MITFADVCIYIYECVCRAYVRMCVGVSVVRMCVFVRQFVHACVHVCVSVNAYAFVITIVIVKF